MNRPLKTLVALTMLSVLGGGIDVAWDLRRGELLAAGVRVILEEPDRDIRALALQVHSPAASALSRLVRPLGSRYAAAVLVAGLLLGGKLLRRPELSRLAVRLLLASLLSAGLADASKVTFGRARPFTGEGVASFHGLTLHEADRSFPSGHAAEAFALATVLAETFPAPAVVLAAHGVATLVALSRVYDDRHFYSDVLAGALLGTLSGWLVCLRRRHAADEPAGSPAAPGPAGPQGDAAPAAALRAEGSPR